MRTHGNVAGSRNGVVGTSEARMMRRSRSWSRRAPISLRTSKTRSLIRSCLSVARAPIEADDGGVVAQGHLPVVEDGSSDAPYRLGGELAPRGGDEVGEALVAELLTGRRRRLDHAVAHQHDPVARLEGDDLLPVLDAG